jgi:imidazolonepropionase-like amidohydrolase
MASGGAMSPGDELDTTQYSVEELRAAVEEARAAGTYVLAHAYSAAAVRRALEAGVRSIEHCTAAARRRRGQSMESAGLASGRRSGMRRPGSCSAARIPGRPGGSAGR